MTAALTITCARPGFRRAGLAHPARAEYPAGSFSPEQLALLLAEPLLAVTFTAGDGTDTRAADGAATSPMPAETPGGQAAEAEATPGGLPGAIAEAAAGGSAAPTRPTRKRA